MTVTIKVNSVIQIPAGPETAALIPRIRAVMEIPNPEYERRKRAGDWLGGTNSTIRASTLSPQGLTVPRGALDIVTDIAQRCGVDVRWGQQTGIEVLAGSHLQWPAVRHDLRPYQIGAIDAAATRMQGVIVAPCGAGKTQIGVGLTAYLGVRTLVLVHMRDLMDQWVAQYKAILPAIEVGIIGGGVYDPREITVAMVQTATKNRYMLKRFDLVILDEAHHCPARTFRAVMDHCPARYRIGLTATPHRADGLTELLYWTMGPVICEVRHAELIADGYLAPAEVRPIMTDFRYDWPPDADAKMRRINYQRLQAALVADHDRNSIVTELVHREYTAGHTILVLSGRVAHCRDLAAALCAIGVPAAVLTGTTAGRKRRAILEQFRSGGLHVVVASTVADEGLDVPGLTRIVSCFPSRAAGRAVQKLGRLMRPGAGKPEPVLYDLVDQHVKPLLLQWYARRRAYKSAF